MDNFDFTGPEEPTTEGSPDENTIIVELVGIKNLQSNETWRLTFDVAAVDSGKIKNLTDQLYKAFYMALIPYDK
jgi:hypothetical protein